MSKFVRPTLDRILVKKEKEEEEEKAADGLSRTPGGILLPQNTNRGNAAVYARVLAVGPGKRTVAIGDKLDKIDQEIKIVPPPFKPGDRVLLTSYAGSTFDTPDREKGLAIVNEYEILAKVVEK